MSIYEAVAAMTENEVLKCTEAMRHVLAGDMEAAKAFIETMTELEQDKLRSCLEAIQSDKEATA